MAGLEFLFGGVLHWIYLVGGFLLLLIVVVGMGVVFVGLPRLGFGRVPLNCPHCGAETPSNLPECVRCGRSFRDESQRPQPIIDAPKLRE